MTIFNIFFFFRIIKKILLWANYSILLAVLLFRLFPSQTCLQLRALHRNNTSWILTSIRRNPERFGIEYPVLHWILNGETQGCILVHLVDAEQRIAVKVSGADEDRVKSVLRRWSACRPVSVITFHKKEFDFKTIPKMTEIKLLIHQ